MSFSLRRFSILHFPINRVLHDHRWLRFRYVEFPLVRAKSNHSISVSMNTSSSLTLLSSLPTLDINVDAEETFDIDNSRARLISIEEVMAMNRSGDPLETDPDIFDLKERQRRERIGMANKGKVPWNKGKQHNAETRERIKERTREALKNPKVRQKMIECPRARSNRIRTKIGSSLRRVWAKRLKWKRSREQFFDSWAESIVEAAKTGGPEQEALDWDSYDTIKQELTQRQIDLALEKEKAKPLSLRRIRRVERPVVPVMDKQSKKKPARVRKSREERIKEKEEEAKEKRKAIQERRDSQNKLKLKHRLSSIRQKITNYGPVPCLKVNNAMKLDVELVTIESLQGQVSLADQIRAAKAKKAELANTEAMVSSLVTP